MTSHHHHHHFHPATTATWADLTADAKDATVRALIAGSMNPDAIAQVLNTTRSAVIGFCFRRKIPLGVYSTPRSRAFQAGREVAPETWAPLGEPVSEPGRKQCCWPVGEASGSKQMFCGLPRSRGRTSYCTTHADMASGRRPGDLPYIDKLRGTAPEVTIEEAVALVRPARKMKLEGAE